MVNVSAKIAVSSVLLLLIMTGAFPEDVRQDNTIVISCPQAEMALERFIADQQPESRTHVETIEIEASLPMLNKSGRLRAIRTCGPQELRPNQDHRSIGIGRTCDPERSWPRHYPY
jgi:hypothetical protein